MTRGLPYWLMSALLLVLAGCSKSQPMPDSDRPASVDRIVVSKPPAANNFLHKTFAVKTYEQFPFTVPAHILKPVLQGSFVSFAKSKNGDLLSNQSADVDLILLNDQEFDDFSHSKQGDATYTMDPSYSHAVAFHIRATIEDPQTYHLVFRNSSGGAQSKMVKADFTVSFE